VRAGATTGDGARRASWGQLVLFFGYSLVNWSLGNGLLPILPSIAQGLGADRFLVGVYLAVSYVALALGTLVAGYLSDRVGHRRALMIVAGLGEAVLIALVSQATVLWELAVLTASAWCLAGMGVVVVAIQAGLSAGPTERGRVLGFLALATPLGSILGGFGVGALADAAGYTTMWLVLGVIALTAPAIAASMREEAVRSRAERKAAPPQPLRWTAPFFLLIVCGVLSACGSFIGGLGRSFAMQATFSNEAITSTVAVSGIVALPFTILVGWMSDRRGRLPFMALCYGAGVLGLLVYSVATSLEQFWIAASFVAFISYVSTGVGSALVVDLIDRPSLGRGMAYFGATGWIGAILAFAGGSLVFSAFGLGAGFLLAAALTALAVVLVLVIRLVMTEARS